MNERPAVKRIIRIFQDTDDMDWETQSWTVPIVRSRKRRKDHDHASTRSRFLHLNRLPFLQPRIH